MQTPIENADDLASQTKIAYGLQRGGSTENFFRVRSINFFFVFFYFELGIENRDVRTHVELHFSESSDGQCRVEYRRHKESFIGKLRVSHRVSSNFSKQKKKTEYFSFQRSTTSEYNIMRNCELTSIGGLLDSKGYGFGVPQSKDQFVHFSP